MPARTLADVPADVAAAAQRVWLAGLGAAAFAQEEGGRLLALLASIGEQTEKQLRKTRISPRAAVIEVAGSAEEVWVRVQKVFDAQVTSALHRLGVPTRDEIASLTRRIEALTSSIDGLRNVRPATRRKVAAVRKAAAPRKALGAKKTRKPRR